MVEAEETVCAPEEGNPGQAQEDDKSKEKGARGGPRGPRSSIQKRSKGSAPVKKRGPPRPHRKLAQEVLEGRIGKLKKRIEKARGQLEDAERHIDGYVKEVSYREGEKKLNSE